MSDEASKLSEREARRQRAMTFWKHLEEMRKRLMRATIGVVVGTAVGLVFTEKLLDWLIQPMGDIRPVSLHPTESIVIYFRVALLLGLVLAMPYILFQLLGFITPGLTRSERRILITSVFGIGFFFALGVTFAGWVMVPLAIGYLRGFLADLVQPTYSIDGYVSFVTTVMLSSGLIFETPLLMALLARLGILSSKQLAKGRRIALVIIAILAAAVTPTPDAFNMLLTMAPLLILYELGIVFAWFAGRARQRSMLAAAV